MKKIEILGIEIDDVSLLEALELIEKYIQSNSKSYIVTPNPEMIVDAIEDGNFKTALNKATLSLPDGIGLLLASRLLALKSQVSSTKSQLNQKLNIENSLKIENSKLKIPYLQSRVPGTDLMLELCRLAAEKGFTIGLLGGFADVAEKCAKRLKEQFPKLNIVYVKGGIKVDNEGKIVETVESIRLYTKSPFDILFVAFGHKKQEKWIYQNLDKLPVKVAIGVGGAFDYISGQVTRAPKFLRILGLEWLFRLITQPWRWKRQIKLLKFVWMFVVK